MFSARLILPLIACAALLAPATRADTFTSPDILILGDSQIPFGSGPQFLKFFENIKEHCPPTAAQRDALSGLGDMSVGVIGVRSTSLHSWTARRGKAKGAICDVDPKWKVNAGTFGVINPSGNKYKQIGRGAQYQFCTPGKSAFEAMFSPGYYEPKLLLMTFLGNSTTRWADSRDAALADVREMMAQLPEGQPCIFMTTQPPFGKDTAEHRLKAQANVKWAFREAGSSCSFIEGATPETVAMYQGNTRFFRVTNSGKVKDPFHPNARASETFFAMEMGSICSAIYEQITPGLPPA